MPKTEDLQLRQMWMLDKHSSMPESFSLLLDGFFRSLV